MNRFAPRFRQAELRVALVLAATAWWCAGPTAIRSHADILGGWDFSALTGGTGNYGPSPMAPTTANSNITFVGLTRGPGVGTTNSGAAGAWGGNGWDGTATLADAIVPETSPRSR